MAFIYRTDSGRITSGQLELPGCNIVAKSILGRGRRDIGIVDVVAAYSNASRDCHSSLWIDVVPNKLEWGLGQIHKATQQSDAGGLLRLIANVKLTPPGTEMISKIPF